MKCDAVFEGGGVKGIGFAGAIAAMERAGYTFENVVGTSAGAIAAALVASGYSGREIEQALGKVDYTRFRGESCIDRLGLPGKLVSLAHTYGVYDSVYFEEWLAELLRKKGKRTFGDLKTGYAEEQYAYKLQVIASDISAQQMLVLPRDLKRFGINPDTFSIAEAVQMSMSIPFYYEPFRLKDSHYREHLIVDGGLLSNYPMWLLDDRTQNPPWPTFGFKFISGGERRAMEPVPTNNIVDYALNVLSTLLEAHDNYHISHHKGDLARSIRISTEIDTPAGKQNVKATDFDITKAESTALYNNGKTAAEEFLRRWDFTKWKQLYRR